MPTKTKTKKTAKKTAAKTSAKSKIKVIPRPKRLDKKSAAALFYLLYRATDRGAVFLQQVYTTDWADWLALGIVRRADVCYLCDTESRVLLTQIVPPLDDALDAFIQKTLKSGDPVDVTNDTPADDADDTDDADDNENIEDDADDDEEDDEEDDTAA